MTAVILQLNGCSSPRAFGLAGEAASGLLGSPVTPAPPLPVIGIAWRMVIAPFSAFTLRMNGVKVGTGNDRLIGAAVCGFGPRSVIIQKTPGPSPGPVHRPLPIPPSWKPWSSVIVPGKYVF